MDEDTKETRKGTSPSAPKHAPLVDGALAALRQVNAVLQEAASRVEGAARVLLTGTDGRQRPRR